MNTVRRIAKNTAMLLIGQVVSNILSLILIVFIARYLGDIGLGQYSFALSFAGLFALFAGLGLDPFVVREVARDRKRADFFLGNLSVLRLILSSAAFLLICATVNILNYPSDIKLFMYIVGLSVVLTSFSLLFRSIFRAFEKMEYETVVSAADRILVCSLGLLILYYGYGLIELALVMLLGSISILLLSVMIVAKNFAKPKLEIDLSFWKYAIKHSLPFMLTMVFATIYFQIDMVMLSLIIDNATVGWYSAAYKLVSALGIIPIALMASIFPAMSRYYYSSKVSLKIAYEKSYKYLLTLAIPMAVGTTMLADHFIYFLYGTEFSHSTIALKILIWAETIIFVNIASGTLLDATNQQKINTYVTGTMAVFNVVLNLLLIPGYSYIGAGIATVLTNFLGFSLITYVLYKSMHTIPFLNTSLKPIVSSLFMGVFLYYFDFLTFFVLVPFAVILYFLILLLLKGIDEEDKEFIKNIVSGSSD